MSNFLQKIEIPLKDAENIHKLLWEDVKVKKNYLLNHKVKKFLKEKGFIYTKEDIVHAMLCKDIWVFMKFDKPLFS